MLWIISAFGSGAIESAVNAFSKKVLHARDGVVPVIFLKFAVALPIYVLMWIVIDAYALPSSWQDFGGILAILIAAEIGGQYYFHKALIHCPLTIITPLLALIPVLMIPFAWLFLGEVPSLMGAFGIAIIAVSVALVGYEMAAQKKNPSQRGLFNGIGYLLGCCLFWSITSVLQKPAAQLSSPAFLGMMYFGGVAFFLACVPHTVSSCLSLVREKSLHRSLLPLFFYAPVGYLQYLALTFAHPSYVMSVKSSARLLNIFWDRRLFKEKMTLTRIASNILSIIGIIVLLFLR